jgi:hypothetical protein
MAVSRVFVQAERIADRRTLLPTKGCVFAKAKPTVGTHQEEVM